MDAQQVERSGRYEVRQPWAGGAVAYRTDDLADAFAHRSRVRFGTVYDTETQCWPLEPKAAVR